MTLVLNRSGRLLPSLVSDLLEEDLLTIPSVLDWDGDLLNSKLLKRKGPSVNVIENANNFEIEVAAPGMEKKDFKVEVDKGVLTISAEKEEEEKEEGENYTRKEFSYNSFSRSFSLPENVLSEKITAEYDNGMLTLSLPKSEVTVSKPAKEIKVS